MSTSARWSIILTAPPVPMVTANKPVHVKNDHEMYMRYFSVFERLSNKLLEDFEDIAGLQG